MNLIKHGAVRYGLALLAALFAVFLRWVFEPLIGSNAAFITVFPAFMIVAVTLGAGPGLVGAAFGVLLIEWFFLGPIGIEFDFAVLARATILLSTSAYVGWVSTRLRAARAHADQEAASAQAAEAALRQQVALIDPARAEIIAREMQRIVRDREGTAAASSAATGRGVSHVPTIAGTGVALLGGMVLLGWALDGVWLKSVLPGLPVMKANTALCFLLIGLALFLRHRRGLRLACSASLCALVGLTLAQYAAGLDFGLDQLLFRDALDEHTFHPGRMAPITALCFAMSGASLLLLVVPRGRWPQQVLALATGLLGLTGLIGYLYDVKQLYQFAGAASMALHTAAGFIVLSVGLLFAREDGLPRVLSGAGPGSQLARRLLPVVILLPILLGWLHEAGERSGVWGAPVGAGLLVIMMLFSLLAVVWWIAHALNRADAARRETEAQLRHQSELMDHADEALIVREVGGVIRFWNKGAAALYGWSAAEALGQRTYVLLRTEGVGAEEKDVQLLRTGHWEGELIHTARDGRRVVVESRQTATHGADGHLLILESGRDITARKLAEDALRESESFYRQTIESVPGMTFTTRPDGYCDYQSQQWVDFTGVPMADHLGDGWIKLLHPDDRPRAAAAWCAAVEGSAPYDLEYRVRRNDGEYAWFKVRGRPIRDAAGTIVRWFGTAVNIDNLVHAQTEIRHLNDQLEQRVRERTAQLEVANRELEAFCYSVSHDLRTPLRTINGFSQAALEDYSDRLDDTGRDYLNRVRNGCRQMDQLIDDLLNLSRVTREQMHLEPVDLTALAQAVLSQLRERAPERVVDIRIMPGLTTVGDPRLLRAAFFNLLENAWKFSAKRPSALIEVGQKEETTPSVFFVRDNGVGFDMQYVGKLFNAFQRLHAVKDFPGTGIGLATVARVIHRHGGRIWADASIDGGATFYFTLEPGLENT